MKKSTEDEKIESVLKALNAIKIGAVKIGVTTIALLLLEGVADVIKERGKVD